MMLLAMLAAPLAQPWMNASDPPEARAAKLVAAMTLAEKIALFHGSCKGYVGNVCANTRLGIPAIKMNDGPQGFRDNAHPGSSTAWPASLAIAATFDLAASLAWGTGMGDEFYRKGSNVQLGPGICLARVPRNGRNFEYISGEDPYLGYTMVQPAIQGIQSQNVVANAKHWVNNNQETDRTSVDEEVDERSQFELYYPPFAGAIAAGVGSFMCSYNKIRSKWSCENPETLQRDLKDRLGFKGWVMSDWGATHSLSINAGLDQEMPGATYMGDDAIAKAVASGDVTKERVDDGALRILTPMFAVGVFDTNNTNTQDNNVTNAANVALARRLGAQSIVLLKNDKATLPLAPGKPMKLALIGKTAMEPVVHGGGSGSVVPSFVPTPYDAIRRALGLPGPPPPPPTNCSDGKWDVGFDYRNQDGQTAASAATVDECCALCAKRASACNYFTFKDKTCWMKTTDKNRVADSEATSGTCRSTPAKPPPACDAAGMTCVYYDDGTDHDRAASLAASVDAAIVFVATSSSEGSDRQSLSFDDGADALVAAVAAKAPKTIVTAVSPGAALMPWRAHVDAITIAFMPGQEYANGLADVLFGAVNPSARLPLTLPDVENEVNFTVGMWPGVGQPQRVATYSEKLLVGYRWYNAHGVTPAFAFGHGLSYTRFTLTDLNVTADEVSVRVTNVGAVAGAAVPQLYLTFPTSAGEPPMQLKGFVKTKSLAPGQSLVVDFSIDERAVSVWDVTTHAWAKIKGSFGVAVGQSSRDAHALKGSFVVA